MIFYQLNSSHHSIHVHIDSWDLGNTTSSISLEKCSTRMIVNNLSENNMIINQILPPPSITIQHAEHTEKQLKE